MALPAEAAAQVRRFDVPAQAAQTGIPMFAHQAGIQILAPGAITEGLRVNRVKGSMEVAAALRLLLSGTDLVPVKVGNAFVLKRRVAVTQASLADTPAQQASGPAADTQAGEDIVVTGIRASLQGSINAKREAQSIVGVITAQDNGKMPDQNVAEAMSRVTGVQISRREGDGSNFTVRGISQNRLEINGRNYIGPGNGGNAALESVCPEIISSILVIKSPTAHMPEGALGATVDLQVNDR